jgi:hypothetical protein
MSDLISNCGAATRETCAGVAILYSNLSCVVCRSDFTPSKFAPKTRTAPKYCSARCKDVATNWKKKGVRRKFNDAKRMVRRSAKSMVDFLGGTRGPSARDHYKQQPTVVIDDKQRYSRCLQCGTEWVDQNNKPVTSSFQFCGESLLRSGSCKQAWIEAHPVNLTLPEKEPVVRDFLDEERLATTKRIHAPAKVKLSRRKLNFCGLCREYGNQDHKHEVRQVA